MKNHRLTLHLLLIILLGGLVYCNTLSVPFVLDDLESITSNESIRRLGNFLPGGSGLDFHLRRSVAYFTFALNYHFGGLAVSGYHLFNLFVHLGTALLVYALLRLTFRTPLLATSRLASQGGSVALLAALFFVVHPIQTQAVTYIVQRLTSLCTLFYLLSLVLYTLARLCREESGNWRGRPLLLLATSVAAALLAIFTKEIAFTLPFAALLYEACFFRGAWRPRLLPLLPLLLTLPIIPFLVLTGGELSAVGTLQNYRIDIPRWHYLLTQFPVIATYLRLLIWPIDQNLDYDYPVYTTLFTAPVFSSLLLILALLALAGWLYQRTTERAKDFQAVIPGTDPAWRLAAFGLRPLLVLPYPVGRIERDAFGRRDLRAPSLPAGGRSLHIPGGRDCVLDAGEFNCATATVDTVPHRRSDDHFECGGLAAQPGVEKRAESLGRCCA